MPTAPNPLLNPTPDRPPDPILTPIPLVRRNRTLSFERRIRLWLLLGAALSLTPIAVLLHQATASLPETFGLTAALAVLYLILSDVFFGQLLRPLQTLANIVAAIREEDYSFRARGARRGDTVGDLALEINGLSASLQQQRAAAQDALTLLERVLTAMHSPVLAFDEDGLLRLSNPAARSAFTLPQLDPTGLSAAQLQLDDLLAVPDQGLYPPANAQPNPVTLTSNPIRYAVRRATFRLNGLPHTLLVLSDVAAVLREEERLAWQRLIRVLSHEINNSLTPISSIASSLRTRKPPLTPEDAEEDQADLTRGLSVIEERAASLHRFLQSYQRLTHLPAPILRPVSIAELAPRITQLETRLPITILPSPAVTVLCDPDQIQQALINLLQNAVDAATSPDAQTPGHIPTVTLAWTTTPTEIHLIIEDSGPGIQNPANLFVPFYTTKPQGSGIGLVLVQQIATAHHGSIAIASKPTRRGCTVTLTLPLQGAA